MASTGFVDTGARLAIGGSNLNIALNMDYNVSRTDNTVFFSSVAWHVQYQRLSGGITSFTYGTGWQGYWQVPNGNNTNSFSASGTRNVNSTYTLGSGGSFNRGVGANDTSIIYRAAGAYNPDGLTGNNISIGIPSLGAPSVDSTSVTNIKPKTASVNFSCSAGSNATYTITYIDYGLTAAYGLGDNTASSSGTFNLTGLKPGTVYHYRIVAVNGGGKATYQSDQTFKTQSVAGMVPLLMGILG